MDDGPLNNNAVPANATNFGSDDPIFDELNAFVQGLTDPSAWQQSAAATINGLDPFGNPFTINDPNSSAAIISHGLGQIGQLGFAGIASALAKLYQVPAVLYHFTSAESAAAIAGGGTLNAGSGIFGTGVYASSVASPWAAYFMGAASRQAAIEISTAGLNVSRTLIPGAFKISGSITSTTWTILF